MSISEKLNYICDLVSNILSSERQTNATFFLRLMKIQNIGNLIL